MSTNTVIKMSIQRMICTGCGAEINAACGCGRPYVPKAQRAAEAVAANPEQSNRAIADNIGVDEKTVRKARATADQSAVEARIGLDGKTRGKPKRRRGPRTSEFTDEPEHDRDLRMLRGAWDGACASARAEFLDWANVLVAKQQQPSSAIKAAADRAEARARRRQR